MMLRLDLRSYPGFLPLLAAVAIGCATTKAGGVRATPDASDPISLASNQDDTEFFVDGKLVGRGRFLTVLVNGAPHRVSAKPRGYVLKDEFLKPPYSDDYTHRFTFLIEDQERYAVGAPPPAGTTTALAPTTTPEVHGVPRIWTFALGVSTFADTSIALQYADADARGVDAFFASKGGGSIPEDRRILLANERATRAAVLSSLVGLAKRTAPDDLLVVFLATHGLPDTGGDLYFVLHDTDPRQLVATGLPQRDLEYALAKAPARRVLLLVDACHSGAAGLTGFAGRRNLVLSDTNRLVQGLAESKPGVALVSASSSSESSLESREFGGGHGVFSHNVVRGLAGSADANKDGLVTVRELFDFVYREVSTTTSGAQHPEIKGTFDNAMPVSAPTR
ncbi:MAG: caspase family protein [Deltaproteobacteria bacterium]|nr:caspase family protein [Deltaproteobacteria bacterium]